MSENTLRKDAEQIIASAITASLPDEAVAGALKDFTPTKGRLFLVAAGKAAWQMTSAAVKILGERLSQGICITKYDHVKGEIPGVRCFEAGHPVPDANSILATEEALKLVSGLSEDDTVIFLLSGGGSALFELPLISLEELQDITGQLLACGADITEINTIRKRLSAVKGGRFGLACAPAKVYAIVLSDVLGDPLDMIASGPAYPDSTTSEDALQIVKKYQLSLSEKSIKLLENETPKTLTNVTTRISGSVKLLCAAAEEKAKELGYQTIYLTDSLNCEAKEAGKFLASIARSHQDATYSLAFIAGGETVVRLTGNGLGGRNQELSLSAAELISDCSNTAVFSVGSDGTDGPTDAAGGYADEFTRTQLLAKGISISEVLQQNDSYHALKEIENLIITGPTGTNVNDLSVVLIKR